MRENKESNLVCGTEHVVESANSDVTISNTDLQRHPYFSAIKNHVEGFVPPLCDQRWKLKTLCAVPDDVGVVFAPIHREKMGALALEVGPFKANLITINYQLAKFAIHASTKAANKEQRDLTKLPSRRQAPVGSFVVPDRAKGAARGSSRVSRLFLFWSAAVLCSAALVSLFFGFWGERNSPNKSGRAKHRRTPDPKQQ
jgi:hypothetical protein